MKTLVKLVLAVAVFAASIGFVSSAVGATPAVKATPAVRQICRQVVKTYDIQYRFEVAWNLAVLTEVRVGGESLPRNMYGTNDFRYVQDQVVSAIDTLQAESRELGKPWYAVYPWKDNPNPDGLPTLENTAIRTYGHFEEGGVYESRTGPGDEPIYSLKSISVAYTGDAGTNRAGWVTYVGSCRMLGDPIRLSPPKVPATWLKWAIS
jgi:hypothetical protein